MYCSKCGTLNGDNTFKCIKCQSVLHPEAIQNAVPQTNSSDKVLKYIIPIGRSPIAIVAGYVGIFSILLFPAPFALTLGVWAFYDIKKHPGKLGMGRAVFSIVMGIIFSFLLALVYTTDVFQ